MSRAAPHRAASARPAPAPAPSRAPHLRVVHDAEAGRRRRALTRACTFLAFVMSAVGLFLVVFLQVLLTQGQSELDRLNRSAEAEAAHNRRLRVTVAELEAPDRVVAVARQRLGMVPPATVTYLQGVGPDDPLPPVPAGPAPTSATTATAAPTTGAAPRPATARTAAATTIPGRTTTTAARATSAASAASRTTATTLARRTTQTTSASRP
ncbi:MAG TPA: hypothetical protein VHF24_11375 [Acidimicrobiales bacterium]|nr:hypothetical protein [Acidimicrobiales bacterium]